MKTYFLSQELWDVVESGVTITETATMNVEQQKKLKNMKLNDHKALYTIQMAVDDIIFPRIMGATKAKEAWDLLKNEFQGNEKVRSVKLQSLRRDLENIKMKDSEVAKDYYSRIMEIANQMKSYGENIGDKKLVEKILISLTDKYDPIVTAIEESKDIATLSVTELMGSLEAYEQRLNRRHEAPIESAFQSKLNLKAGKFSGKNEDSCETLKEGEENYREARWRKDYSPCRICGKIVGSMKANHSAIIVGDMGISQEIVILRKTIKPIFMKLKRRRSTCFMLSKQQQKRKKKRGT
ncbi:uncharacterized protein LOC113316247 [Papaver somniferum]|uniref:uncharacterized protein LOC113316247 n=1 Tax=Papaver somniferum TaxID=3469 RepID=UPI000E700D64|nr:uncharacterized protein LOC113316247 [Papaver somniferum]